MVIKILGERIRVIWQRMASRRGLCEAKPTGRRLRRITIDPRLSGRRELDTYIHEMLHVGDWYKDDDEWVAPLATDMARVLWKLGYRKAGP